MSILGMAVSRAISDRAYAVQHNSRGENTSVIATPAETTLGNLLDPTRIHDRLDEIRDLEPGLDLRLQARLGRLDTAETAEHVGGLGQRHDHDPVAIAHHDVAGVH